MIIYAGFYRLQTKLIWKPYLILSSKVGNRPCPTTSSISIWIFFWYSGWRIKRCIRAATVSGTAAIGGIIRSIPVIINWSPAMKIFWFSYWKTLSRNKLRKKYEFSWFSSALFISFIYRSSTFLSCSGSNVLICLSMMSCNSQNGINSPLCFKFYLLS